MKKSVNFSLKLLIIFSIFFVLLCLILINIHADTSTSSSAKPSIDLTNASEDQKKAYDYGKDLSKFAELSPAVQNAFFNPDYKDYFMAGLEESLTGSKSSEEIQKNYKIITDLFLKKDSQNKLILNDEIRNKIWESIPKDNKNGFLKNLANGFFNERYKNEKWADSSKMGIKNVNIDDPNSELKWVGNKLSIVSKDEKSKSWIDFENIPRWANKIEYSENKFTYGFFTGRTNKDVSFNSGTIGAGGEVIGPDGKTIGVKMNSNLKNIVYENGEFKVTYLGKDKDGKDSDKTITFNDKNMPVAFARLKSMLNDPSQKEIAQKMIESVNSFNTLINTDETAKQISSGLSGTGIDLGGSLGVEYQLNVMYGSGFGKTEKIDLNFDEKGKLTASVSNGGTLATTDSHGNVLVGYNQFYSAGGIVNTNYNSGEQFSSSDENGEFKFNSDGTLEAAKNGAIKVDKFGSAYTSRTEYTQVDIFRNPYVDLLMRKDTSGAISSILSMGNPYVSESAINEYISKLVRGEFGTDKNQAMQEGMNLIKQGLSDPSLSIDLKRVLNNALDSAINNLEITAGNLADYSLFRSREDRSADENAVAVDAKTKLSNAAIAAVGTVLNDPDNINALMNGDSAQQEKVKSEILQAVLGTLKLEDYKDNSLTDPLRALIDVIKVDPNSHSDNKLNDEISKLSNAAFRSDYTEQLKKVIQESTIFDTEEKKQNALSVIGALAKDINDKVETEGKNYIDRVKNEITSSPSYENKIVMDIRNKEVYITGNQYQIFNAETTLNKFVVKNNGDNNNPVYLLDNNKVVAKFTGSDTSVARIVGSEDYYSIGNIINGLGSGSGFTLDNSGYGTYSLRTSDNNVNYGKSIAGAVTIPIFGGIQFSFPIVGAHLSTQTGTDIGQDPEAYAQFQFTAGMDRGRIFNWIMRKQLTKKYGSDSIPLSEFTSKGQPEIAAALGKLVESSGGYENLQSYLSTAGSFLDYVDSNGISVPRINEAKDVYSVVRGIQSSNGQYYSSDVNKLMNFLSGQRMSQGSTITITNSYISVDGNRITSSDVNPALFRLIMRGIYYGRGYIPNTVPLKK